MNFRKIGWVLFLALLLLLYLFNRKQPTLLTQHSFLLSPIGNAGYSLQSILVLHNPNLLSTTIKTISEKYYLDGKEIAILRLAFDRGIPGLKETVLPVNVRLGDGELNKIFRADTSGNARKTDITVTGEISYENLFGGGSFSFSKTDSILISTR